MEPLALKLEMLKGPREGETLDYRPGSKVRIGRVVRGNNLPIKDSGISTNHLIIDSSESGQWLIRDLNSSNGTTVNDAKLDPNTPSELKNGDQIKIGEYTSISVKIFGQDESRSRRRNPRRGAAGGRCRAAEESEVRVESEVEVENDEVIGGAAAVRRRGRVAKRKNEGRFGEGEEIEEVEKPKRGRGRPPRKVRVLKSEGLVEEVAVPEVSSRVTERCENMECVVSDSVKYEQLKIEPKRRGRGRKKKNVEEELLVCDRGDVAAEKDLAEVGAVGVNDDRGEAPAQKELAEIGPVDLEEDDGKGLNLEYERHEEAAVGFDVGESGRDNEMVKGSNLGNKEGAIDCNVGESGDKVECGIEEGMRKGWEEPDLEKMTLDDWFDYVEVSWPKVVNDEIDKICSGMIEKAKLVQEYIQQHKKEKDQS